MRTIRSVIEGDNRELPKCDISEAVKNRMTMNAGSHFQVKLHWRIEMSRNNSRVLESGEMVSESSEEAAGPRYIVLPAQ